MSPDAAGLFAQVQAALLIATVVEMRGTTDDRVPRRMAFWNPLAVFAVFFGLAVNLSAVAAAKPLPAVIAFAVAGATAFAAYILLTNAFHRAMVLLGPEGSTRGVILVAVFAVGVAAFGIWAYAFLFL
jgi:multidrug transporter EmrE-like cation transporter